MKKLTSTLLPLRLPLIRLYTADLGTDESTEASMEQYMSLHKESVFCVRGRCLFDTDIDSTLISFSISEPSSSRGSCTIMIIKIAQDSIAFLFNKSIHLLLKAHYLDHSLSNPSIDYQNPVLITGQTETDGKNLSSLLLDSPHSTIQPKKLCSVNTERKLCAVI